MRVLGAGHILFAIGLAGIGFLSLISGDFAYTWQPVPAGVPARALLAHCLGLLLLVGGVGMCFKRTAEPFALIITFYLLSWVLVLQAPIALKAPGNVGAWLGFSENLVLMTGGWILFASLANPSQWPRLAFAISANGVRIARYLFGAACLVLGLSHFVYADFTAGMVPAWLPYRVGFAYLTGAGHFAAGIGVLCGILPRLAATLEAAMITSFVILVHIPGMVAAPTGRMPWTILLIATAMAGAVWIIAKSLQSTPWGFSRKRP